MEKIIKVECVSKNYKSAIIGQRKFTALDNVTIEVNGGEIYGLLGPNGAGKTTLLKIMLGLTYPTKGRVELLGKCSLDNSIKGRIGYLPEDYYFPPEFTGWEYLNYVGMMYSMSKEERIKKIDDIFHKVGLIADARKKIKAYSKGMKRKLGLAQAVIHSPDILFLDEPTEGLDPIGRKHIRDILTDLHSKGKTIILNSHLLSEVEMISNRVAILNKGNIVNQGTISELIERSQEYKVAIPKSSYLKNKSLFQNVTVTNGAQYTYIDIDSPEKLDLIVDWLREHQIHIESIERRRSSLEEYFIQVVEGGRQS